MSSRAFIAAAARKSLVLAKRSYHVTALQNMGGFVRPPLPPFARSPPKDRPLPENMDAVWDDGVAPELALDFDAPHISTREAVLTLLSAFGVFWLFFQAIKVAHRNLLLGENPALGHYYDIVDKDYSDWDNIPEEKPKTKKSKN
ncbi:hypothetical protein ACA910_009472 [Epithemia clementina (nom. ined.)]